MLLVFRNQTGVFKTTCKKGSNNASLESTPTEHNKLTSDDTGRGA